MPADEDRSVRAFGDEKQYTVAAEVLNLFDKRYRQDDSILEPGLHANIKVGMRF